MRIESLPELIFESGISCVCNAVNHLVPWLIIDLGRLNIVIFDNVDSALLERLLRSVPLLIVRILHVLGVIGIIIDGIWLTKIHLLLWLLNRPVIGIGLIIWEEIVGLINGILHAILGWLIVSSVLIVVRRLLLSIAVVSHTVTLIVMMGVNIWPISWHKILLFFVINDSRQVLSHINTVAMRSLNLHWLVSVSLTVHLIILLPLSILSFFTRSNRLFTATNYCRLFFWLNYFCWWNLTIRYVAQTILCQWITLRSSHSSRIFKWGSHW